MDGITRIGGGAVATIPGPSWHAIGTGAGGSDILLQNIKRTNLDLGGGRTTKVGGGPVSPNAGPPGERSG